MVSDGCNSAVQWETLQYRCEKAKQIVSGHSHMLVSEEHEGHFGTVLMWDVGGR